VGHLLRFGDHVGRDRLGGGGTIEMTRDDPGGEDLGDMTRRPTGKLLDLLAAGDVGSSDILLVTTSPGAVNREYPDSHGCCE